MKIATYYAKSEEQAKEMKKHFEKLGKKDRCVILLNGLIYYDNKKE